MQERFAQMKCLTWEAVSRLDRMVAAAQIYAEANPEQSGVLKAQFFFSTNEAGEVIPTWKIEQAFADRKTYELGRVRNGQLVMVGTDVLSDTPPGEADSDRWKNTFLAAPAARR